MAQFQYQRFKNIEMHFGALCLDSPKMGIITYEELFSSKFTIIELSWRIFIGPTFELAGYKPTKGEAPQIQ
jgi:hypothetical protein